MVCIPAASGHPAVWHDLCPNCDQQTKQPTKAGHQWNWWYTSNCAPLRLLPAFTSAHFYFFGLILFFFILFCGWPVFIHRKESNYWPLYVCWTPLQQGAPCHRQLLLKDLFVLDFTHRIQKDKRANLWWSSNDEKYILQIQTSINVLLKFTSCACLLCIE